MLTIREIQEMIVSHVCEIQQLSGRPVPKIIDEDFKPIGGCEGFESINGVEVAVRIEPILGCEIKGNPFADGYSALTVQAIAKRLYELQPGGASNAKR
jgi:hypothetical protein